MSPSTASREGVQSGARRVRAYAAEEYPPPPSPSGWVPPSPALRERGDSHLTPGAQVAAAIEILAAIDTGEQPGDDVAADYFRCRRYIGAKDRANIAGHVYAVLRHRAALDWWIRRYPVDIGPRGRVLAALVLVEGWRVPAGAAAGRRGEAGAQPRHPHLAPSRDAACGGERFSRLA